MENSVDNSCSVVLRLRPDTPRQVDASGASLDGTCRLLFDSGDLDIGRGWGSFDMGDFEALLLLLLDGPAPPDPPSLGKQLK